MKWNFRRPADSNQPLDPNDDAVRAKTRSHMARLNIVYTLVFFAFVSLILRLGYLQIVQGASYRNQAMTTTVQQTEVLPARGRIFDANGDLLAGDNPEHDVYFTRLQNLSQAEQKTMEEKIAKQLAPVFKKTQAQVMKLLTANPLYAQVRVFKNVSEAQLAYVESNKSSMPGISVQQTYTRSYPYGDLAGHVLGYVSPIQPTQMKQYLAGGYQRDQIIGQSGLEQEYESLLQGSVGDDMLQINVNGSSSKDLGLDPPPVSGDNLELTLDGHLQAKAQEDIMNVVQTSKYKSIISDASAVVLDVKTGGVLAMVSYPYIDPNWFEDGSLSQHSSYLSNQGVQSNNAIQSPQKPGSTVKPANLIIGLEHGVVQSPTIAQYVPFQIRIGSGNPPTILHDDAAHGTITAAQAITQSSDVFFYEVGLKLGHWYGSSPTSGGGPSPAMSMSKYLKTALPQGLVTLFQGEQQFGLGQLTGIDLPNESPGVFYYENDPSKGYPEEVFPVSQAAASLKQKGEFPTESTPATLAEAGIGQVQMFTPIQMAQYVATIANNGVRMQPHLLKAVLAPSIKDNVATDKVIKTFKPVVQAKLKISSASLQLVHQGMYGVTHNPSGTAYAVFANDPIDAAGKTGTADISLNKISTTDSVFIAYAPYNNPQIAVAVMVPGAGYGADTAAPIAKDLMDAYFAEHHSNLVPKSKWTSSSIPSNWKSTTAYTIPESAK